MKRIFLLTAMLMVLPPPAAAAEPPVAADITDVVVFTDRALVTRKGSAAVAKGINRLRVPVDAFSVDPDAVTAEVRGRGEILAVQYRELPAAEPPQERIREITEKIRRLRQELRAKTDERGALERQEEFLRAVVEFSKTQVPAELKTRMPGAEELGRTLAFVGDEFSGVYARMRAVDQAVETLNDDIRQLERELQLLRRPGPDIRRIIEIQFDADGPQNVGISATYMVRQASWSPLYRAAVPADLSGVDLTLFARIVQKTGEDWRGVSLAVSNVVPLAGARVPDPRSWWLDLPRPLARAYAKSEVTADAVRAPMAVEAEQAVETGAAAAFAEADRRVSELSFEYAFKEAASLESGGGESVLPVFTRRLTGDFYRYAVPRESALTYLVCEARADRELLGGPLNVYFSGRFVGKMMIEERPAGEAFRLGLGADRQVAVKREKVLDRRKETFFGKIERDSVVRELGYRLVAENLRDQPATLWIVDSLPVSRTDRIRVDDLTLAPPPDDKNVDAREGVMRWRLTLAPGERKTIEESFTLVYPKDMPPAGF